MNEQAQEILSPWEGAEVIHSYSRAQALEDGFLIDLSVWAKEAGFKFPLAVTQGVMSVLSPLPEIQAQGENLVGRVWDMLNILRHAIRTAKRTDEVHFAPLFTMQAGRKPEPVQLWAKCGPGDMGEPVISVMLEGED